MEAVPALHQLRVAHRAHNLVRNSLCRGVGFISHPLTHFMPSLVPNSLVNIVIPIENAVAATVSTSYEPSPEQLEEMKLAHAVMVLVNTVMFMLPMFQFSASNTERRFAREIRALQK